jgi:flavodoxin I
MNILIVFGSLLGKTMRLAVLLGTELKKNGFKNVVVKDVRDTDISEIKKYDLVIFGCSTWDDGMLQVDFREFNNSLIKSKLSSKKFAVFGVGSRNYVHYCTAADIISSSIKLAGGYLILEPLKLDLDHDEEIDKCDQEIVHWGQEIAKNIL